MKTLIVGFLGEVGSAMKEILYDVYGHDNLAGVDVDGNTFGDLSKPFDIMHVCFSYSENFIDEAKKYQKKFKPKYTIIHSTVPVGTTKNIEGACHSPIRGIHPNLEQGIRTFVKFIGGEQASEVADYFRRAGLRVALFDKAETTEAMKLFDTEYYRTCIEFAQRVKRYCDKMGLNFSEVYTIPNQTYNEGYVKLGNPEFVRPVLQPIMTKIGGHCVAPNSQLIKLSE